MYRSEIAVYVVEISSKISKKKIMSRGDTNLLDQIAEVGFPKINIFFICVKTFQLTTNTTISL